MDQQTRVRWAELRPDEFLGRLNACPLVFLPVGLCEPHGHVAAFGLDTIIADHFCDEGARRYGGIVAPTQGYHVQETGYHAAWLEDMVGENNGRMAAVPPHVLCQQYLYQLRTFANAGFRSALVMTGHGGGNELDLQAWGDAFAARFGLPVKVIMEAALAPDFPSDHAGKYEISALWHIRPDLIDMTLLNRQHEPGSGGRLALGDSAAEASPEHGAAIVAQALANLGPEVQALRAPGESAAIAPRISYSHVEALYSELRLQARAWVTASPRPGQRAVSAGSQWQAEEWWSLP